MEKEKEKECKSCNKGFNKSQKFMIIVSIYILLSCIFGTYKIFQYLGSLI